MESVYGRADGIGDGVGCAGHRGGFDLHNI